MKQITTDPGAVYCVYTATGCTVTDTATGCTLMTAEPGQPNYFAATGHSVTLSDADATCLRPRFKSAPAALRLLGGGADKLPAGYTRVEFLETVARETAYVQLGVDYFDTLEIDITPTKLDSRDYFAQAAQEGKYRQGIESYSGHYAVCYGRNYSREHGTTVSVVAGERVKILMDSVNRTLTINGTLRTTTNLFAVGTTTAQALRVPHMACLRLHGLTLTTNDVTAKLIPALDPNGKPCMYDLASNTAFKNRGTGQFIAGVGTVAQLTALLRNLPASGGTLTLSLPAEANTPEVAEQLQACHDTKGWTITVHEYRPAAAATYSLRRVREVVWCRVAACEHGSYVAADGTRWQIERCAAIFGPNGQDPADYGYTPFDSVEAAAEQWNLTPYIAPEEEQA